MNIKQQYLLSLLGLDKRGALADFDSFATKYNLNFGKSTAVAEMLAWYGSEINNLRLKKVTSQAVMNAAEKVQWVFNTLDILDCSCLSPSAEGYPEGLLTLQDAKKHVICPPYLFCKGDRSLLGQVKIALAIVMELLKNGEAITSDLVCELKTCGGLPLIPMVSSESSKLVRICFTQGVTPVLLLPGGLDSHLLDLSAPFADVICDVLERNGLLVSVHPPGTAVSRQITIKTQLYVAGFCKNILMYSLPSGDQSDTYFESARINGSQLFSPEPILMKKTNLQVKTIVSKRSDVVYLKQGFKLCGLLR